MISAHVYHHGQSDTTAADPDEAAGSLGREGVFVWFDIEDPSETDLSFLGKRFGFHPVSIEDAQHRGQRAKVELFDEYAFVVLHPVVLGASMTLEEQELHAFVGDGYLITVRSDPPFAIEEVVSRWERQPELIGPGFALYALLDEVVDGYLGVVERLEDLADDLEDEVFVVGDAPAEAHDLQQRIFRLKRETIRLRRYSMPLRQGVDLIQERPTLATPELGPYYRDVMDHVIRVTELVDNIRDLLTSLLEVRLAQAANRLNENMKQMTAWAGIVLVPTLIAGIYGMNFVHMPELRWAFGYPFAMGVMALSALALYVAFKRRGWL